MLIWTALRGVIAPGSGGGLLAGLLYILLFASLAGALVALGYWLLGTRFVQPYLAARWLLGFILSAALLFLLSAATTQPDFDAIARRSGGSSFMLSTLLVALVLGGVIGFELFSKAATERVYLTPAEYGALPAAERERYQLEGDPAPVP
jgi:hypothetical protein